MRTWVKAFYAGFGSLFNYFKIEKDGSFQLIGDATVWDDLTGSLVGQRLNSSAGTVDYNWDENSITMSPGGLITNVADRLIFNFQKPHAAKDASEMRLHIHWEQADATAREFTVQYRVQGAGGAAKTTDWTTVVVDTSENSAFGYTGGTINQITRLVAVDLSEFGLSSTVQFRFARTDSEAGDIEATFIDAHIEYDMLGSRQEYVK